MGVDRAALMAEVRQRLLTDLYGQWRLVQPAVLDRLVERMVEEVGDTFDRVLHETVMQLEEERDALNKDLTTAAEEAESLKARLASGRLEGIRP